MIIPIRNIGMKGEIKDILALNMPIQGVTSARNMRIESQALRTFSNIGQPITPDPTETAIYAKVFWRVAGDGMVVVRETTPGPVTSIIFIDRNGVESDITPVGGLTNSEFWYAAQSGEWFILTNGVEVPQFTTAALPVMVDLPGWPATYKAKVIETYKNFLVAVAVTKAASFEPTMVKWSHPVSPGDTTTFWDFTDPTILAGETVIQEPGRDLRAAHPFRDTCMLYFDRATWRMDFVGGQAVMDFQRVFNDDGAQSAHAWANAHGEAFVFGFRDVYRHDGHIKESISDLRLTDYLFGTLDFTYEIIAEFFPKRNEVWFLTRFLPSGDGNLILLYNTEHDAWTEEIVEENGEGFISSIAVGPRLNSGITLYSDWTGETYTFLDETRYSDLVEANETVTVWGTSTLQPGNFDLDYTGIDPVPLTLFRESVLIEHLGIDLDELGEGVGAKIIYINRAYPQIDGSGSVLFTFGSARTANGPFTWQPSVRYYLEDHDGTVEDYAVDVRLSGRYLAYRVEPGPDSPAFTYTGLDLDVQKVGAV